jgi:RNA polymerase primary sigma factor
MNIKDRESGCMDLYLSELRRIPALGIEEEKACARQAAQGDEAARQRLVSANLRFVIMMARRYRDRGVPLEDLVNEGNLGLIRAAGRFDPDRGVRFVSYAAWWIRHAILTAVRDNGSLIRVPHSRSGNRTQISWRTISLDSPVGGDEDAETLGSRLEDRSAPRPEEALVSASLKNDVGSVLAGLSDREAGILNDRYGITRGTQTSLREVCGRYGLSKERVRQIEKRAMRKIRVSDASQLLHAYTN